MPRWRHSPRDAWVVALPALLALLAPLTVWLSGHGLWGMSLATCAIGLVVWWVSNTAAHIHLHTPVFRARLPNRLFSLALSLLTGVPQTIWRARHLAHHRGEAPGPLRLGLQGSLELAAVAHLWLALAVLAPRFLLLVYLPGFLLGLGLCQLQGLGEHPFAARGGVSHDGRLYNLLWLNDGLHAEHHRWPGAHWTALPARRLADAPRSPWPPVLRGLHLALASALARGLGGLERLALRSPRLQARLVASHARALARLMPELATCLPGHVPSDLSHDPATCPSGHVPSDLSRRPVRIAVIGGGLFPRTALALARVWPAARVTIVDADAGHLARARAHLAAAGHPEVELVHAIWDPRAPQTHDLVIVPLALVGDRAAVYSAAGPPRLVHDWLWRRRGPGVVVSWPLLKRLNLVHPRGTSTPAI
ncbi:MAG: fatty acid desaturase [Nannocystis sp.]|uniref:fatty acid desaturase n=1 Tax=Nannocystis sp. TaxID=1962667 RepID=UPI0024281842|nr:fatty acid desaturase [Nannocystis sp.]MBK9753709.1 fatty acid desaturase [Nannocystis sp.]